MWMVIIIVVRDLAITGLRAYADYKGDGMSTSLIAKGKTFIQMVFIYYLLLIYTLMTVPVVYEGREKLFSILTNSKLIYFSMLFVTIITFYTGITYIYANRHLIRKMFGKN